MVTIAISPCQHILASPGIAFGDMNEFLGAMSGIIDFQVVMLERNFGTKATESDNEEAVEGGTREKPWLEPQMTSPTISIHQSSAMPPLQVRNR